MACRKPLFQTRPGRHASHLGRTTSKVDLPGYSDLAAGSGAAGAARLARLAATVPAQAARPVPVRSMPARLPSSALPAPRRGEITIGVDVDFLNAVTVRLLEGPLLVAGRVRSGRTSMLAGLGRSREESRPSPGRDRFLWCEGE